MECIWGLYRNWAQIGYFNQPDKTVFPLHLSVDLGVSHYHLHDTCLLERPQEVYAVHPPKSLAQPLKLG